RIKWLEENRHRLVAAGGIVDDRNDHVRGGLMIVKAQSREEAERFANKDPFIPAGLYESLEVVRWRRVFFNHQRITEIDPFQPDWPARYARILDGNRKWISSWRETGNGSQAGGTDLPRDRRQRRYRSGDRQGHGPR